MKKNKNLFNHNSYFLNEKDLLNHYAEIINSTEEAIYSESLEGVVLSWNKGAEELYGYEAKEIIGQPISKLFPKSRENEFAQIIKRVKEGKKIDRYQTIRLRKDGQEVNVTVTVSPMRDQNDELGGISVIAHDITHRIQKEQDFRLIAETIPHIVWTADRKGEITYFNRRWFDQTGMTLDELKDLENWRKIMHPEDFENAMKIWVSSIKKGIPFEIEYRFVDLDKGGYKWFLCRALPVKNPAGKIVKWFGTCTDIDAHKKQEERKDDFISIASHELKTPLSTIKGFNQILQQLFSEQEKPSYYLSRMNAEINRLTSLVSDLLDVSKIQAKKLELKPEVFDLCELTKSIINDLQQVTKKHKLILDGEGEYIVNADKYRLSQVIINLLSNAIKYSPKGDKVIVHFSTINNKVCITVEDFGIGIARKNVKKVFDRFFQADNKIRSSFSGLGLGLFISEQIVRRHGGDIWVESEKGKGSKFIFTTPLYNQKKVNKENQLKSEQARILI